MAHSLPSFPADGKAQYCKKVLGDNARQLSASFESTQRAPANPTRTPLGKNTLRERREQNRGAQPPGFDSVYANVFPVERFWYSAGPLESTFSATHIFSDWMEI